MCKADPACMLVDEYIRSRVCPLLHRQGCVGYCILLKQESSALSSSWGSMSTSFVAHRASNADIGYYMGLSKLLMELIRHKVEGLPEACSCVSHSLHLVIKVPGL